ERVHEPARGTGGEGDQARREDRHVAGTVLTIYPVLTAELTVNGCRERVQIGGRTLELHQEHIASFPAPAHTYFRRRSVVHHRARHFGTPRGKRPLDFDERRQLLGE